MKHEPQTALVEIGQPIKDAVAEIFAVGCKEELAEFGG
jgi:hypothetical protein